MTTPDYPAYRGEMNAMMANLRRANPGALKGFGALHAGAMGEEGAALPLKFKEMIALAISVTDRCDACIAFHAHGAVAAGATDEEIADALGVAVMMGGGPAAMYASQAWEAVRQYRAAG